MTPSAFELGQKVGSNIGRAQRNQRDRTSISEVMDDLLNSGDDQAINRGIAQILQNVSPENQPQALKALEGMRENSLQRQKFEAGERKERNKPAITLTESLNQVGKRFKEQKDDIMRPYVKESLGATFLDFEEDDKNKAKVLSDLEGLTRKHMAQVAQEFAKYGEEVPQDVLDAIEDQAQVKVDEQIVSVSVAKDLEEFSKKFSPKKYEGKTATDSRGNKLISDGEKWTLVGQGE